MYIKLINYLFFTIYNHIYHKHIYLHNYNFLIYGKLYYILIVYITHVRGMVICKI
ncbi:hypothetical protein CNEO_240015 [Clostridium neonatale]|nr:hypothetical protein CNEO_240015 [Clostridium neonatale]CAI3618314.1 hypothetical protein CNEO2_150015 [Clostridium neonatale]